jgi:hypothetical protein
MKNNKNCDQKVYFLNEADYQYLAASDYQSNPKLVKLFKSKSPWESENAIAEVRTSLNQKSKN